MRYLIAAAVFGYLGYAGEPIYAAEQLTPAQMDQVTAGAWLSNLNIVRVDIRQRNFVRVETPNVPVTVSQSNSYAVQQ